MKKLIVLLAILTLCQVAAFADPITLDLATLATFSQVGESNAAVNTSLTGIFPNMVRFDTSFPLLTGPHYANVGNVSLNIDQGSNTMLALNVFNSNENPWTFELFVTDGSTTVSSGASSIVNGFGMDLSVAIGTLAGNITGVWVQVSGVLPIAGIDRTAEYDLSPVPEPASMLLLGSGLLGLGVLTRKWRS